MLKLLHYEESPMGINAENSFTTIELSRLYYREFNLGVPS